MSKADPPRVVVAFASHAHVNRGPQLDRFVAGLRDELVQYTKSKNPNPLDLFFIDADGNQTGEEWDKNLAGAVARSRVCVALCSPAFLNSDFCGKELQVFLDRVRAWGEKNPGKPRRGLIPVIWVEVESLPDAVKPFYHATEAQYPKSYFEHGLRALFQLSKYRDDRLRFLTALAKQILELAEADIPPRADVPNFALIRSVFEQRAGTRYGVAVVALTGNAGPDARPYGGGPSLRALVDEACGPGVPWRSIEPGRNFAGQLRAARRRKEAVLVVVDLNILRDPLYGPTIAALDAAGGGQTGVVLLADPGRRPGKSPAEIIRDAFPASHGDFWDVTAEVAGTPEKLRSALEESITRLRGRLIDRDPPRKAVDPAIQGAAAQAGIPIEQKPVVTGPEGA